MSSSCVVNPDGAGGQDELPHADPTSQGAPMAVGHCQEANGGIVEQRAMRIADDFGADPQWVGLAREGESNLQSIAASIARDRERVEQQSVLADTGHERRKHFVVGDELGIERHRNQSFTMRAKQHRSRSYGEAPGRARNLPDPPDAKAV